MEKKKRKMGDNEIISFSLLPRLFEHFPSNCCEASGKCPYGRNITRGCPRATRSKHRIRSTRFKELRRF